MPGIMLALPMVVRELQVAARRRSTYMARLLGGAGGLVVAGIIVLITHNSRWLEQGEILFYGLSGTAWVLALLSGLGLATDTLSAEKREGTLGLLFLTDLRCHDILLGKLTAHVLQSLGILLALLPLISLPLLMGGVTPAEVGRMALSLWTTAFLSVSIALAVSAFCVRLRAAFTVTVVLLAGLGLIAPWAGAENMQQWAPFRFSWSWVLFSISPICALLGSSNSFYHGHYPCYWVSVGAGHFIAILALAAAWWRLARAWHEDAKSMPQGGWREKWHRFWTGSAQWRADFRRRALSVNPCYWLFGRDRWGPWVVWFPVVVAVGWWSWGLWEEGTLWLDEDTYMTTAYALAVFYKLWFAWRAALPLGEARREQTLEMWLTAPVTPAEALAGQWRALWRMFRGPLVFMVWLLVAFMILTATEDSYFENNPISLYIFPAYLEENFMVYYFYGVVSLFDLAALGWLGMWLGFRLAHPHRAAMTSILLVMSLPWLGWILCIVTLETIRYRQFDWFSWEVMGMETKALIHMALFLGIHIGVDLWAIWYGRSRLQRYFRQVAATPAGAKLRLGKG